MNTTTENRVQSIVSEVNKIKNSWTAEERAARRSVGESRRTALAAFLFGMPVDSVAS